MSWSAHIIDANLNRAREGLRVLEELSRFVLRDETLFKRIKEVRHELKVSTPHRDIVADVGAGHPSCSRDLISVLNANASRVQEALRVLEECGDDRERFSRLRFATYDIHQALFVRLQHDRLRGVYIVVDMDAYDVSPAQAVAAVNARGAKIVQLRHKSASKTQIISEAKQLRSALPRDVLLIVNDHLDVALAFADGVHLGRHDFPVAAARRIAPVRFIVGASANNVCEAVAAQEAGATYVSMGCVFDSTTKSDTRPIAFSEIALARSNLSVPLCVIGGINDNNMGELEALAPDMIAMCAGVFGPKKLKGAPR